MAIIDKRNLTFFRSIAWGGLSVSQAIAMAASVPIEEAEKLKIEELNLSEEESNETELREAANQAMGSFLVDLQHTLAAFRSQQKLEVSSVLLTGGTSCLAGIQQVLSKSLGKPVDNFNPFASVKVNQDFRENQQARFGEPLGRAMVFGRKSALLFNFRKQELAKATSLKEVVTLLKNPNVVAVLLYAGILAGILFLHVLIAKPLAESEFHSRNDEVRKVFQDTFRSVPNKVRTSLIKNPNDLKKFLDQKNNELDQKIRLISKNRTPMLGLIRTISESFPPEVKVDVNSLELNDRNFVVEGVVYEGDLNHVTELLTKNSAFKNVALEKQGQRFTVKGDIIGR